ncbi:uncharacterized protein K460DRAFT_371999 [Cucurbitaria berberidis CBS 394.84]|uniref:Uncharacterized protein n=1 Tax=Cucurbitaria berberidis CBS 394.84 TaxID=1168544 RepID=A0A9P4G6V8_9PLEO|nr:uncharacterized protein K460DRAFT_371999 [Cucurbitaria berberidis CBS 394.84]KAF1840026.1 hypothetical protein K460DRAFT_371999 [Cucurbitaria berberidis CBS 394.84]
MASNARDFSTTYAYEPLQSRRHIRILTINDSEVESDINPVPIYSLVQVELPIDDEQLDFEAISGIVPMPIEGCFF